MRTIVGRFIIMSMALLVAMTLTLPLHAVRVTKSYSEEYRATEGMLVSIDNRYGQVNIESWDKPTVTIEVTVWAEAGRRERAETILDAIDVSIRQVKNEIRAVTTINDRAMKSSGRSSNEFRIDYQVRMPKNLDLNLQHRYGDAFISSIDGRVKVDIKYGNLKVNSLTHGAQEPLNSITIGYGNATIDNLSWGKFDIKYSNVAITQARAMVVVSKYSKLNIDRVNSMVIESKYDQYNVGSITNVVAESGYTNYRFNQVSKSLDVKTRYGDVRVGNISPSFESIRFEGSYATLNAPIPSSASYQIDAEAQYGGLSYGSPNLLSRVDASNRLTVTGAVGERSNPKATVWVRVRYGSANLK